MDRNFKQRLTVKVFNQFLALAQEAQDTYSDEISSVAIIIILIIIIIIIIINNKRQFVRRHNMSVDITRAPYRQTENIVRDSSTETRL